MQNVKVLVISNLYPSKKTPFYGSFVKNFVSQLSVEKKVKKIDLALLKGRHNNKIVKLYKYILFYCDIFYKLLFFNYDLVYVHLITHSTIPLRIVGKIKKLNIVFNIHGEDLLVQTRLSKFLLDIAIPTIYKAKFVVVPSFYFFNIVKQKLPLINTQNIIVSPSGGVNPVFFSTPHQYLNKRIYKIGYVSRIDRGKGWDILIEAINKLKNKRLNIEVKIVGDGLDVEKMNKIIVSQNLKNIKYIGPIAHEDLPFFYKNIDLFIFPTLLEESLGLVGLEAMAAGVPVIASKIGGIQDYLLDDYNGYFFEVNNFSDLALKIEKFILLPSNKKEDLSRNAIETAKKYESNYVSKNLFNKLF